MSVDMSANPSWNGCCRSDWPSGVGPNPHIMGVPGRRVPTLAAMARCPAA